ncbi:hypothetical protein [Segatella oulorum]|uniref:hypothetical protein n=1 Tax=Segatella oulorum TaxID=28136 RepID=UPI00360AAA17
MDALLLDTPSITTQCKDHFFGSIVSKIQPGTEDRLIIDGQQRTAEKINILRGMFDECNIPASELVFEFRTDGEEKKEG